MLFNGTDQFKNTDKQRFYSVRTRKKLTFIILCQAMLRYNNGETLNISFISRSAPRTSTRARVHTEERLLDKLRAALPEDKTGVSELSLVVMSTYSPCSHCREKILYFLKEWEDKVSFTLRIARLYHEPKNERDAKAITKLQVWSTQLHESRVRYRLEAVCVSREMPLPTESDEDKSYREEYDKKIQTQVDMINKSGQQVIKFPQEDTIHFMS